MAKQVAALPAVADAHRRGEISNGQLGTVAAIAQAGSEQGALDLAKTATSSQLQRQAVASRGQLTEKRLAAQKGRYLAFKPEEDGQSTRLHGRLPFAEARQLESQLRKIADRIGFGDKERPSPRARMADALLILTKGNASVALHEFEHSNRAPATDTHQRSHRQGIGVSRAPLNRTLPPPKSRKAKEMTGRKRPEHQRFILNGRCGRLLTLTVPHLHWPCPVSKFVC